MIVMHSILRFFTDLNRKNTTLIVGGIMVAVLIVVAVFAPLLEGHDPTYMQTANQFIAPCAEYPFGTDNLGRCILCRVIEGARISLVTATLVVLFGAVLGSAIGLIAGFAGGKVDGFLMRVTDIFLAFPTIVFALAVSAVLGTGTINLIIALMCIHWTRYARLVRGEIVLLRNEEFIESARAIGNSSFKIATKYLLPSVASKIIVMMSLDLGSVILFCSSLSFLGLGAQPGTADWGQLIAMARNWVLGTPGHPFAYWYTVVAPGGAIFLFVLGWNLLGDAFRDILDPRQA